MEILTLWPFSQGEMKNHQERFVDLLCSPKAVNLSGKLQTTQSEVLLELLVAGGYPPVAARDNRARRDAWFQSYIMTMLQRDIRDLANIADSTAIPRLLNVVAARAGNLLNFADLSRTMALPQTTLKRYFALLEGTFLVRCCAPGPAISASV